MEIKVINNSAFSLPSYETQGSAGMDIKANIPSAVFLAPLERRLIPTGLFIEIPQGFECQIRPRSGLALKKGIGVLNSPGTIDSDYRGEILVPIRNTHPSKRYTINNGDRIAQLIGNVLLVFIDEKTKFGDFFNKDEIITYKNINDLSKKIEKYSFFNSFKYKTRNSKFSCDLF